LTRENSFTTGKVHIDVVPTFVSFCYAVRGHLGHGLSEYDHDYNYSLLAALKKCVLGVGHEHFLASCLSFFFLRHYTMALSIALGFGVNMY
jgi:hypothetical protein